MKALQNTQIRQTENSRKVQNGEVSVKQKQCHKEAANCGKRRFHRGAQAHVSDRQVWEEHQRQSMESVSGANGWMHAGIQDSHFFYPSILH